LSPDAAIVVGDGRLGLSLASGLAGTRLLTRVAVVGRGSGRPDYLRDHDHVAYAAAETSHSLWAEPRDASLGIVFAVGDDQLAAVIGEWADRITRHPVAGPLVALHTSGFHPAEILRPIRGVSDAEIGGWHPLVAIAKPAPDAFEGITVGTEGSPEAVAWATTICHALGAVPVTIPAGGKARYHASAVFASNYLVASLGVALAELEAATGGAVDESALLPLARAAIDNVAAHGIAAGATGPIVRGDVQTIAGHLAALDPARAALYRALGRELLDAARQRNSPEIYEALKAVLREV
jgi:predicted short-subunit dehydrogenase-like oxidoreductase (DUF2520 family)